MLDYRCEKETAVFSSIFTNPFKELPQAFELHGFGEFKAPPSYYTRRRDYDQCLLFYTISGEGRLEYHQQTYHLGAGSIAVINCRDPQYYYTNSELWHFLWFHFDGQTSFPLVDYINDDGLFIGYWPKERFLHEFDRIKSLAAQTEINTPLEISLTIHQILAEIMGQKIYRTKSRYGRFSECIQRVLDYMSQNSHKKITVEELAKQSCMSKYYFIRVFRDLTGVTPYRFLLTIRLRNAKNLLSQTTLSIQEIAEATGFTDAKSFITNFKKETGMTPNRFRHSDSSAFFGLVPDRKERE